MALLGWGPSTTVDYQENRLAQTESSEVLSREILDIDELIEQFSLKGINRKPAAVHEAKLLWMNKYYFKQKLKTSNELAVQLQVEVCKCFG